jgi:non-specific serine/threonine protein kinase
MQGAEYISADMLLSLWQQLEQWAVRAAQEAGGIHAFLSKYAPSWKQVGRVCFHLAENKRDPDLPFAFLATYSTGFNVAGTLQHLPLGQTLKQYADKNQRQALLNLLTPVQAASEKCTWVQKLADSGEIYRPLGWTTEKAYQFLISIPALEEAGLSVRIPNWWRQRPRPKVSVNIGSKTSAITASSLLQFDVGFALGDLHLSEEELTALIESQDRLVCFKGQWVEVDGDKLKETLEHWKRVQRLAKDGSLSFIEGMRLLAGAPVDFKEVSSNTEALKDWIDIHPGEALAEILQKLRDPGKLPTIALDGVKAQLRPYQHEGVKWMHFLSSLGMGACLADDMGLGKTVQILALLQQVKNEQKDHRPSLLIVPASLLSNWQSESERFTPSLRLLLLHSSVVRGADAAQIKENPADFFRDIDLVITTYSMVTKFEWLSSYAWQLVILDEAQAIKNADTKQAKAIKALEAKARIALTGTPVENRVSDLWSLFDFLNPSLLGTAKKFKEFVSAIPHFEPVRRLVGPYILRRMKTDPKIISDLPDKVETLTYCHLSKEQAALYQSVVEQLAQSLETAEPTSRRGLVLRTLLELKQICNHPAQYLGGGDYAPELSGKFERIKEICEELASRQEKVLIFTQFSEIIPALDAYLAKIFGRPGLFLHGATPVPKRKELVQAFQEKPEIPYFILSIKAGGTGLTLTAANHVIHLDRWWNPAVENQATDRAYRIGQKKNVQVRKFITLGTVEEHIETLIANKTKLASELFSDGQEVSLTELSDRDLLNLLSLDINKATLT